MKFKTPSNANLTFQGFFWAMISLLSLIVILKSFNGEVKRVLPVFFLNVSINIFLANFNLYFLIPNLAKARKWVLYGLSALALLLICTALKSGMIWLVGGPGVGDVMIFKMVPLNAVVSSLFVYVATLPFLFFDYLIEKERMEARLETQKLESEVRFLRAQLNPHFLFNVLNNVYSMIFTGSEDAGPTVMKLSELMRYMLYQTEGKEILLSEEVSYLEKYINLHVLKQGETPTVNFETSSIPPEQKIPPLLLIPLFENAFKYSNWDAEDGTGWIRGLLQVKHGVLMLDLSNTIAHQKKRSGPGGIGLENIQKRLQLIYPRGHELDIQKEKGIFKVSLSIDFRKQKKFLKP